MRALITRSLQAGVRLSQSLLHRPHRSRPCCLDRRHDNRMKPWREVAVPHKDVLEGTFQQSEFAADITAVNTGKASHEYQDAVAFYDRTYITEGMGLLITQVSQRLAGKGG